MVPPDAPTRTASSATEPSKLEFGKEEEKEEDVQKDPQAKYDDDSTTYNETMALLKKTTEQLDALEQTRKQNPVPYASEIQTASARDYYKEAALKDFNEMVDAKFKEVLTKRGKWS